MLRADAPKLNFYCIAIRSREGHAAAGDKRPDSGPCLMIAISIPFSINCPPVPRNTTVASMCTYFSSQGRPILLPPPQSGISSLFLWQANFRYNDCAGTSGRSFSVPFPLTLACHRQSFFPVSIPLHILYQVSLFHLGITDVCIIFK